VVIKEEATMKKIIIICFIVVGFLVPTFLFASSCDSEAQGYFVKFTLEEQEYNLTNGFTDIGTGEPYIILYPGVTNGDLITFFGSDVESESSVVREDLDNVVDVRARLFPHTHGIYEDDYDAATNTIHSYGELDLYVSVNSEVYLYNSTSGTITISVFGEEGDVVEGTFNVTLEGGLPPAELGDPSIVVTGEFRLKRISIEDIPDL
jgi:hypothetical protein